MTTPTQNASDWQPFGSHSFRFLAPDTYMVRLVGDVTDADIISFLEIIESTPMPPNGFFYVSNLTEFRHQSMRRLREHGKRMKSIFRYTAIVGASYRHRLFMETLIRTFGILGFNLTSMLVKYFDTEAEALAFFDELKRQEADIHPA